MDELVIREDRDGAATLTLNRPDKLNALNVDLFRALDVQVGRLEHETESVGVVIVRGAGRCFSAGHDLGDIAAGERLPRANFQAGIIERLANLPQPVISAVHGHCYTGALELALAGDIIFASSNAKFAGTPSPRWALTPVWGLRSAPAATHRDLQGARDDVHLPEPYSGAQARGHGPGQYVRRRRGALTPNWRPWPGPSWPHSWFSHRGNKRLLIETDGLPLAAGLAHEVFAAPAAAPDMEGGASPRLRQGGLDARRGRSH